MSYTHLSDEERYVIYHLRLYKQSFREIARRLGRCHTTIAREVARALPQVAGDRHAYVNGAGAGRYKRLKRRAQHRRRRAHTPLWRYVRAKLKRRWSPEQIACRVKQDYPHDRAMRVAPETIYTWVYRDAKADGSLYIHLRRAHKRRRKQKRLGAIRSLIKGRVSIHERPDVVAARTRIGDWEGDTVLGAKRKGAVVTLVERKSRVLLASKLHDRTALTLARVANRLFKRLTKAWRRTLTLDNGMEFARFKSIEQASQLAVYFADPYASHQRGLNENTNGLLRQYFPKGCDFHAVTDQALASAVREINNRPRKCLGFRTPNEVRKDANGALSTGI
jgi:IS30 family transposase